MRDSTESTALIQTRISFGDDGTILVEGAPGPERNYRVAYGQVALTEQQAATAERLGWHIVLGRGNGELAVVERNEKEWRDAMANVRRGGAA